MVRSNLLKYSKRLLWKSMSTRKHRIQKRTRNMDFLRPCTNRLEKLKKEDEQVCEIKNVVEKVVEEAMSDSVSVSPRPNKTFPAISFVLDGALLTKAFVRKKWKILCSDEDASFIQSKALNPNDYRPEIVYKALRTILDSPLNKLGLVAGGIYVRTDSGHIFHVKPHLRIPRTCKRFCGVVLDLLDKGCVRASDTGEVLMRVLEGPITLHLPPNSSVIGLSYHSPKLVNLDDYVSTEDSSLVFLVGTMVNGSVSKDYANDYISVSNYRLSAKYCIGVVCGALERKWKAL